MTTAEPDFFVPKTKFGALRDHYRKKNLQKGPTFATHYAQRQYLKAFTPKLLEFVSSQLNPDLLLQLGYAGSASGQPTGLATAG